MEKGCPLQLDKQIIIGKEHDKQDIKINIYLCVLLEFDEQVMNGDDFVLLPELYLGTFTRWVKRLGGKVDH